MGRMKNLALDLSEMSYGALRAMLDMGGGLTPYVLEELERRYAFSFIEIDGKRFAKPESIIDSKVELVNTPSNQSKHQSDLNNIMINIYS